MLVVNSILIVSISWKKVVMDMKTDIYPRYLSPKSPLSIFTIFKDKNYSEYNKTIGQWSLTPPI